MTLNAEQIKHMVDRFLAWKLPSDFRPDGGITFEPVANAGTHHEFPREPVGTNLLTAAQAQAMMLHLMEGLPAGDDALLAAAQGVIDNKFSTYKARNGREVGIQADDGEMCWIVHSDDIYALEAALGQQPSCSDNEGLYYIRKNGMFYRPNASGYTSNAKEAGRYTLEEAIRHSHPNGPDGPRDGITYEPLEQQP